MTTQSREPMNQLNKKREDAWTQWKDNAGLEQDDKRLCANFSSSDMRSAVQSGFDAMRSEHERIVKGLVEALERVSVYNKNDGNAGSDVRGVDSLAYWRWQECISREIAYKALEAYKRECGE